MRKTLAKGHSILAALRPKPFLAAELEQVLSKKYGSSVGDRSDRLSLLFPGHQENYALRLIYNRKRELVDIFSGPELSEDDLADIVERIEVNIYTDVPPKMGASVLFSNVPVAGRFLRKNNFQIIPVPPHAPQPTFLMADHPFLLEVEFKGSPDPTTEIQRHLRRSREVELLICALLGGHIYRDGPLLRHHWVMPGTAADRPQLESSVLLQGGYHYPGKNALGRDFSPGIGVPPIDVCDANEYYSRTAVTMGQYLDIPSSFDQTIEAFEALLPETQKIFLVASSWFQHASRVFHLSHSASFVALTLAIEALLPKATTDGICECCKREKRKGPTSLFKEFLSKFAPHQQIDKEYTKRLSDFYRVRSKIVHEGGYLRSDRSLFGELAFGDMDDWTLRIHLSRCVQIALVNWLLSSAAKTHT